jgi:hypothetical protein
VASGQGSWPTLQVDAGTALALALDRSHWKARSRVTSEHCPRRMSYNALVAAMSTFLGIVIAAVSVITFAFVAWVFVWAAKKDGEEDRDIQKRLGIRRRTRLGP